MKKLHLTLGACLTTCVMLLGCNSPQEEAAEGAVAGTAGSAVITDTPNDGSVLCPGDPICPLERDMQPGPPWSGVLIPPSTVTPDNVVCIPGQNRAGSPCPDGWNGRLWKPVNANIQTVCRPGSTEAVCQTGNNGAGGYYGFFCRDNSQKCPGVPKPGMAASPPGQGGGGGPAPTDESLPN